jgi:hypothetical protein
MRRSIKKVMDNPMSKGLAWALGLGALGVAAIGTAVYFSEKSANAAPSPGTTPAVPAMSPANIAQLLTTPVAQTPSQYATPAQILSLIQAGQNALVVVSSGGKVSGLSYTTAQANVSAGNASDPTFVQQLSIFQTYVNSVGGYMPPSGSGITSAMQLNTSGVLDYATLGALVAVAQGNAPNLPQPTPTPSSTQSVTLSPGSSTSVSLVSAQTSQTTTPTTANSFQAVAPTGTITTVQSSASTVVAPISNVNAASVMIMASTPGIATVSIAWTDSSGNAQGSTINVSAS